jgi:hypothetical protein
MSRVAEDIRAERARQVEQLGYGAKHDDQYQEGELLAAAASYALASLLAQHGTPMTEPPSWWPWPPEMFRPGGARRALVKSASLIQAEIERFDRHNSQVVGRKSPPPPEPPPTRKVYGNFY